MSSLLPLACQFLAARRHRREVLSSSKQEALCPNQRYESYTRGPKSPSISTDSRSCKHSKGISHAHNKLEHWLIGASLNARLTVFIWRPTKSCVASNANSMYRLLKPFLFFVIMRRTVQLTFACPGVSNVYSRRVAVSVIRIMSPNELLLRKLCML